MVKVFVFMLFSSRQTNRPLSKVILSTTLGRWRIFSYFTSVVIQATPVMLAAPFILACLVNRNVLSPSSEREALIPEHHNWPRVRVESESAIVA